jgi:hypothetical protein
MAAGHPVVVRVPKYRREELEKDGVVVSEYIDGKILSVERHVAGKKQCAVTVRDGLGRDVKILAVNVIRFKGRGDYGREGPPKRASRRKRPRVKKREQMSLLV